jgi:hypothetical protein
VNLSLAQHNFDNPTPLIPTELAGTYGEFEKVKGGDLNSVTLGGGGAYTLVLGEKFWASALGMINYGSSFGQYETTEGDRTFTNADPQIHFKLSLGYNGDRFIGGARLLLDSASYSIEKTNLSFQTLDLSIFLGTRF